MMNKTLLLLASALICSTLHAGISGLTAQYRNGQVFLQWQESDLSPEARLTVWGSSEPITEQNFQQAEKLAENLNANSARDWWWDVSSFLVKRSKAQKSEEIFAGKTAQSQKRSLPPQGFIIEDGGKPIPVDGGLHVHTPMDPKETGKRYYAVSCLDQGKNAGFAALANPVEVSIAPVQAIRISGTMLPFSIGTRTPKNRKSQVNRTSPSSFSSFRTRPEYRNGTHKTRSRRSRISPRITSKMTPRIFRIRRTTFMRDPPRSGRPKDP